MESLALALKKAGLKSPHAMSHPVPAPASKRELVKFTKGTEFVLIFNCPRKFVPEGIQVLPAGGGNGAPGDAVEKARFRKARVDLEGLESRCLVDSINIREKNGFCRVYVNCTVTAEGHRGFHFWRGVTGDFVRKEMKFAWEHTIVKKVGDRMTLELRSACQEAEVKIGFAIEG